MSAELILRIVHVLARVGWLGEVLVVNFVLSPALRRLDPAGQAGLLAHVFPRVFRLATALGGLAVLTGVSLLYLYTAFRLDLLLGTRWGHTMLVASSMALGLYVFHLTLERKLLRLTRRVEAGTALADQTADLAGHLTLVPAIGAFILGTAAVLMIYAAHVV